MVLFKLNHHIITFFFFIALLLLKQSISEHNNVPSRSLKDSKLLVPDTGVVQEKEQDEIGSSDSPSDIKKKENVEDEEREKEGKKEIKEETKDEDDEIESGKNKKKNNKANKDEEKTEHEEFDENEKKKVKDDDIGKGEKGIKGKKVKKEDENGAYEEVDENGIKKKTGEKDDENEAYEKFDENGKKKKKDGEQTGYEKFDENGKEEEKKKKKDEEFHDTGMQKETKDEEKAKEKKHSSSSDSFNSVESLLSLTDSLKKNPTIPLSIVQGCKKADFPPECEATLLSSEKDAKKFDASSIFETSVKALSKALNVSKTLAQNPNSDISPKDASDCEKMYKDSISASKSAMKAFKEKDKYMTSLKLSTVVTNMDTCENGIGKDSTSDLGRANKVLSKLAANAISLGDAAMHFNTDE